MTPEQLNAYKEKLDWNDELGIGLLEPDTDTVAIYDKEYFSKYFTYEDTDIGRKLNQARIDLVEKYTHSDEVLDIGIGSGQFVREADCYGTDINPYAIEYLRSLEKYAEIGEGNEWEWVTMWDVLEHLPCPNDILKYVQKGVILSMPIYDSKDHVLRSKHFRPNEHIWYFTIQGLIYIMGLAGFKCLEFNRVESDIGREDIGSFVFVRVSKSL